MYNVFWLVPTPNLLLSPHPSQPLFSLLVLFPDWGLHTLRYAYVITHTHMCCSFYSPSSPSFLRMSFFPASLCSPFGLHIILAVFFYIMVFLQECGWGVPWVQHWRKFLSLLQQHQLVYKSSERNRTSWGPSPDLLSTACSSLGWGVRPHWPLPSPWQDVDRSNLCRSWQVI